MAELIPPDRQLFFSKQDPLDPRLGDHVQTDPRDCEVVLVGYPDDEGVRLNGGREGAELGPHAIRQFLYRTTPHPRLPLKRFADLGDLSRQGTLAERHEAARALITEDLRLKRQVLSLGGGNDYAYSDGRAFLDVYGDQKPLILNIDAHLDVRDLKSGLTSGTPFYRLLECGIPFEFIELGAQSSCNAKAHWDYVLSRGGTIISQEEILDSGRSLLDYTIGILGESLLRRRPAFLALDIDTFAWPFAMGSSAAWPLGLEPQQFWPLFQTLLARLDVRVMGIYEVAPGLEAGSGTSKLAAQLAHRFLHRHV